MASIWFGHCIVSLVDMTPLLLCFPCATNEYALDMTSFTHCTHSGIFLDVVHTVQCTVYSRLAR